MRKRAVSLALCLCMALSWLPSSALAAGKHPFTDVAATDWFNDSVQYAYEHELMKGTSDTTFAPYRTAQRGMIVTILYRLEGTPAVASGNPFTDVPKGSNYENAIIWASSKGIVTGYNDSSFGPYNDVTRQQMAAILYRYAQMKGYDTSTSANLDDYADSNQISNYAKTAMAWANGAELINGNSSKQLMPAGNATRAQTAAILSRFCQNVAFIDGGNTDSGKTDTDTTDTGKTDEATPPTPESYTVTFDLNYEDAGVYETLSVKAGEKIAEPKKPTRNNYSFSGWYTDATKGSRFNFKKAVNETITLYARWNKISSGGGSSGGGGGSYTPITAYTVTFNANGGSAVESKTVNIGSQVSQPNNPSKTGYAFDGWYSDAQLTNLFNFTTPITSSITLYAKWIAAQMDLRTDRNLVMIGNDNTVYFYLQSSMPAPSDGKFNLCEVSDNGYEVVAELYDDGLYSNHGDDMAGDGVYSAKLSEAPTEDSVKSFVASNGAAQSNRVEVKYYTPISEGTLTTMQTVDNEISALISAPDFDEKTDAEKLSAVEAMINGFKASNLIVADSAYYDETAGIYVFEYAEGILGGVTIHKFDPVFNGSAESVVEGSGDSNEKRDEAIGDSISLSDADDTGNTGANDGGNTNADDTGNTGANDSGNTNADDTGNANDSGNTNADDTGNANDSGNTNADDTGNTGANDGGNTDADNAGGNADGGNTGSNDGGNSNADDSGNSENVSGQTGKALILNAFPSFETKASQIAYRTTFYQILRNTWNQKGLETTLDTSVTVDDFKRFQEYDVVVIATHGSTYVWHDFLWFGKHQSPAICLSERSTKDKDKAYEAELKDKQIVKVNGEYNLLSTFFENAYGANELSGKFIFSECCQFMGEGGNWDYSMANGIISRGASAIVGFHNSVFADYSREFMSAYVGGLLDGKTSQSAYNEAISKMGANHAEWFQSAYSRTLQDWWEDATAHSDPGQPCPPEYGPGTYDAAYQIAYPHLGGEPTSKLVNAGLKNGDFESFQTTGGNAVPTDWTIVGDVRSLDRLGEVKPQGAASARMAILTTGIGAKTTATVGEGTEGSSISQRVIIPQTANTLKFDYNFVSEEPMEFVGTQFNDSFGIRLFHGSDVVFEKTYESINASEWHGVSGVDFYEGDNTAYQTGWKTVEIDVSSYRGQTISISFIIYDVGDSIYDSACVIDNVALT